MIYILIPKIRGCFMKKFVPICLMVAVSAVLLAGLVGCQEETMTMPAPAQSEPKTESVYGEVTSVNEAGSSMAVQYYDYDTDEEKVVELVVDNNTKLENAAALKDIKVGDWVDTDYSLAADGKKTATSVKVEKAEEPELPDAAETAGTEEVE